MGETGFPLVNQASPREVIPRGFRAGLTEHANDAGEEDAMPYYPFWDPNIIKRFTKS